ncbi:Wzz/FepE/Etk N-terminal domain-containing protein [Aquincola tertiaricarbonis]|uniref:Wzz/FepE/Etk N-terminal domain-containing protein n=1 Tax=Aquincola tertiaricarbonis TaxID=391953 RepID=A0ABY4SDG0_AQUTE|nr:Wzz/FepE/Etk N-terminal domain-containing protein [Aquincola tertiaricarbonis]URI09269.1 Wzz/FepE/Etk N-terminal domain-containing protein [Aquincola tertiaricarbonis]
MGDNMQTQDARTVWPSEDHHNEADDIGALELGIILKSRWKVLVFVPILAGAIAYGGAHLIAPTFTAQTTFLPPQQQQSSAASALASLGALAGLTGGAGVKTPADQYVAFMQSATVSDRIIERFDLMQVYESKLRTDARKTLAEKANISVGKKDGLISVTVDDEDPQRAAAIANAYVEELRRLSASLAVTEAQQRRVFFEQQLAQTKERLTAAQRALEASGFTEGALRSEPKSAAESYARLQAEVTAAEVRLQTMRSAYNENAPEFRTAQDRLAALRSQLAKTEKVRRNSDDNDYVGKYREFKYQETLFDLFARQYELARVDESREGALIQVVDAATPPERRSKPKRSMIAAGTAVAVGLLLAVIVLFRHISRLTPISPQRAERLAALKASLRSSRAI